MTEVIFENLCKSFGGFEAVKDVNLTIKSHEFIVLVGPSGCGKSTTLRMLAGLEEITSGIVRIGERIVNYDPPRDRDIAMVFQNYALYQHMNVYDNLAFGLRNRKVPEAEIKTAIAHSARMLNIEDLMDRRPVQLSGGQQQRVALGRCLVRSPAVFLFDEPLSNLDAKLRAQMRLELKELHQRIPTTSVYVTHDQVEAMTLGHRIVVMKDGLVQQVGTPLEVYRTPSNKFVAGFIGAPAMNFIDAPVTRSKGSTSIQALGVSTELPERIAKSLEPFRGRSVSVGIRPEHMLLGAEANENIFSVEGQVAVTEQLGSQLQLEVRISGSALMIAGIDPEENVREGDAIGIGVPLDRLCFFDPDHGQAIHPSPMPVN